MPGMMLNRSGLAGALAVAPTTVDGWVRRGCPSVKKATSRGRGANGWQFDLAEVVTWLREEAVKNALGDADQVDPREARRRLDVARTKLTEEQREKAALEVRRLKRELVEVSEVGLVWARLASAFRSRILGLPSKLAGQLVGIVSPAVIREKIEAECHQALAELSDEGTLAGGFPADDDEAEERPALEAERA